MVPRRAVSPSWRRSRARSRRSAAGRGATNRHDRVPQLQTLAEVTVAAFGRLDVWVNNAGGFADAPGAMAEWLT